MKQRRKSIHTEVATRKKMDNKYAVVYYDNETGIRRYPQGYTLEECKDKIRDHYKAVSEEVDKMSLEDFEREFILENKYRPRLL